MFSLTSSLPFYNYIACSCAYYTYPIYAYEHVYMCVCHTGSESVGDGIQRPPSGLQRHPARDRSVRGGDPGGREGHGGLR